MGIIVVQEEGDNQPVELKSHQDFSCIPARSVVHCKSTKQPADKDVRKVFKEFIGMDRVKKYLHLAVYLFWHKMCMKADKGGAVGTTFKGFTMEEATDYMCLTHQPERVFIANHNVPTPNKITWTKHDMP